MNRTTILLALALAVVIGGSLLAAKGSPGPESHIDFEVVLGPLDDAGNTYFCQATFRDLETGEVFSAPKVTFLKGKTAIMETRISGTGRAARLVVHVSEAGTATYELEVRDGERPLGRHKATVDFDS